MWGEKQSMVFSPKTSGGDRMHFDEVLTRREATRAHRDNEGSFKFFTGKALSDGVRNANTLHPLTAEGSVVLSP